MAYTVDAAFDTFHDSINLSGDHRETANARKERIIQLLGKHFTIVEAFATGSIPKFTALKNNADLDVMVALHYSKHIKNKSPQQVMQDVRAALAGYRTEARRNGQAITLYYDTWPNVDVVPVSQSVNSASQVTHYNVPDSNTGNWIESKPKTHAANIEAKSSECGRNFRRIIKMAKWWNSVHSNYLQSYHIEVLALKMFHGNIDDTTWNVFQFFSNARPLLEGRLWHELGYTDDYMSANDRQEILKRIDTAIDISRNAWFCTHTGRDDHKTAISYWKQMFGEKFPAYG